MHLAGKDPNVVLVMSALLDNGGDHRGQLINDDVVIERLKNEIYRRRRRHYILNGFPRTIVQARALRGMILGEYIVINLKADIEIIKDRMMKRRVCVDCKASHTTSHTCCEKCGGGLIHRRDDTPEVIERRIQVYNDETQPILEHPNIARHLFDVNANLEPKLVEEQIRDILASEAVIV
jgi:adenylate kinase